MKKIIKLISSFILAVIVIGIITGASIIVNELAKSIFLVLSPRAVFLLIVMITTVLFYLVPIEGENDE